MMYLLKEDIGFSVGASGMSSTAFFYDLKACAFFVSEAPLLYKCDICSGKADILKDETNKSGII